MPSLEVVEGVLVQCNLVDNQYQQKFEGLCTFALNKSYAYLFNVEPSNLLFLNTYKSKFGEVIITFKDQNGRRLQTEDKFILKLVIKRQKWHAILQNQEQEKFLINMNFCYLQKKSIQ